MGKQNKRRSIKEKLVKIFGSKCAKCKKEYPPVVFDFHHINPKKKNFAIGNIRIGKETQKDVANELENCMMLCSNCHRIIHYYNLDLPKRYIRFKQKYKDQKKFIQI